MPWQEIAQFELSQSWQWTAPIAGAMFRLRHLTQDANTRGLISQALFVSGKLQLFESQRFSPKSEEELILFRFPDELISERRIAAKLSSSSTTPWTVAIDVLEPESPQESDDIFALYIAAHKADLDPHPQYAKDSDLLSAIANLTQAIDGKEETGTAIARLTEHLESSDPHGQYVQQIAFDNTLLLLDQAIGEKEDAGTAATLNQAHLDRANPHPQYALADPLTGLIPVTSGGTGANTSEGARIALKLPGNLSGRARQIAVVNTAGDGIELSAGLNITSAGNVQTIGVGRGAVLPGIRGDGANDFQSLRSASSHVASGVHSTILGGVNNTASGANSVAGGEGCISPGQGGFAVGRGCAANHVASTALGSHSAARGYGELVHSGGGSWVAQRRGTTRRAVTTTNNPTVIHLADFSDVVHPIVLVNDSAVLFRIYIAARNRDAHESAAFSFVGLVHRDTTASSIALAGTPVKSVIARSIGATTWDASVAENTVTGGISVSGIGENGKVIHWGASFELLEVVA